MVAASKGHCRTTHWAVDSLKNRASKTKTWVAVYGAGCMQLREGEQRQPAIEAFTETTTDHAVENLSYVKVAKGSNAYAPPKRSNYQARSYGKTQPTPDVVAR